MAALGYLQIPPGPGLKRVGAWKHEDNLQFVDLFGQFPTLLFQNPEYALDDDLVLFINQDRPECTKLAVRIARIFCSGKAYIYLSVYLSIYIYRLSISQRI